MTRWVGLLCLLGLGATASANDALNYRRLNDISLREKEQELLRWNRKLEEREAALRKHAPNFAATIPTSEVLVFEEKFDSFDHDLWKHEITMGGGGNWEFQYYTNNRTNSYVENNVLYMQPTLSASTFGEKQVSGEEPSRVDLWGMSPADECTSNQFYGCERMSNAAAGLAINPVQSARVRTAGTFSFKYGRLEVEAKLPRGDWYVYGQWPASGEIDLMESRGNKPGYSKGGYDSFSSCMHWGPYYLADAYDKTYKLHTLKEGTFNDKFHIFGLVWNEDGLFTYVDTEDQKVLVVDFTKESFWERGGFDKLNAFNPWAGKSNAAPFDQNFYLIFNVAVGGLSNFFAEGEDNKPWSNSDRDAALKFHKATNQWYSTWAGKDSALQIKSVRVWQNRDQLQASKVSSSESLTKGGLLVSAPTGASSSPASPASSGVTLSEVALICTIMASVVLGIVAVAYMFLSRRNPHAYQTIHI